MGVFQYEKVKDPTYFGETCAGTFGPQILWFCGRNGAEGGKLPVQSEWIVEISLCKKL